jgi:hypothetical protein
MTATTFFAILCVLQVVDAWTTYKGLKAGSGEGNPVLRAAIKAGGIKGGLLIVKGGILLYVWNNPISDWQSQALLSAVYLATIAHNLQAIKRPA